MNDRDAFLADLAANEDDVALRLVYADWLDERGEHEEADRQRRWPQAKAWFVQFCQENNPTSDDDERVTISYDWLIDEGRQAVERILASRGYFAAYGSAERMLENGWRTLLDAELVDRPDRWSFRIDLENNLEMAVALRSEVETFWANWSVLTGLPLPPGAEHKSSFMCGC